MIISSVDMTIWVPDNKILYIVYMVEGLLDADIARMEELESLMGTFESLAVAMPQACLWYQAVQV